MGPLRRVTPQSLIVPEVVAPTPPPRQAPAAEAEPRPATALTEAELQEIINAAYN